MQWLDARLKSEASAADVQATLAEFTARSIIDSIDRFCIPTHEIYLAGGGARNPHLVSRMESMAGGRRVAKTDSLGVPTEHVESMAFAWLAMKCIRREPVDLACHRSAGSAHPRRYLSRLKTKEGSRSSLLLAGCCRLTLRQDA